MKSIAIILAVALFFVAAPIAIIMQGRANDRAAKLDSIYRSERPETAAQAARADEYERKADVVVRPGLWRHTSTIDETKLTITILLRENSDC